ncbi:MAG: alpha/beta fold hydrolase [Synechococcales cyanobacterium]
MAITEHRVTVGSLDWFFRQGQPTRPQEQAPPVVLLHGLVSQSYGWMPLLTALEAQGYRALAPDWIGCGLSDKPERWEFSYRPEALAQALHEWLAALEIERFSLVVQGFLGSVGLRYALEHPDSIERLVILNTPMTSAVRLPWSIRQLGIPLVGDMLTQDPLLVDRTLETGGIYRVKDRDLDVYRRPFLTTSASGRALLATVQHLQLPQQLPAIAAAFRESTIPTLIAWGMQDPWLPFDQLSSLTNRKRLKVVSLEQVGHYPQHDWPEKVIEAVIPFLGQLVV